MKSNPCFFFSYTPSLSLPLPLSLSLTHTPYTHIGYVHYRDSIYWKRAASAQVSDSDSSRSLSSSLSVASAQGSDSDCSSRSLSSCLSVSATQDSDSDYSSRSLLSCLSVSPGQDFDSVIWWTSLHPTGGARSPSRRVFPLSLEGNTRWGRKFLVYVEEGNSLYSCWSMCAVRVIR